MKKFLLLIFSCFLIFGCFEQNGDVKKESLKKESSKENKKRIKFSEFKNPSEDNKDKMKEIWLQTLKEYNLDKDSFKKLIDDNDEKINIIADDFNKENKITPIGEKKTDKIKVELYESQLNDDDFVDEYYIRGNITFSCVSNRYFSFDRIIVLTDKNRYEIKGDVFSQDSDFEKGKSYQNVKYVIDNDKQEMIFDIAHSKNVRIRFTKNDNNLDFVLSNEELERIKIMDDFIFYSFVIKAILKKVNESLS